MDRTVLRTEDGRRRTKDGTGLEWRMEDETGLKPGTGLSSVLQSSEPDLSVKLCGVRLPNPTVLASGILGLSAEV
ncbi:MAG: hypothetical protein C4309_12820, partial [Chloroflexota bacterium]